MGASKAVQGVQGFQLPLQMGKMPETIKVWICLAVGAGLPAGGTSRGDKKGRTVGDQGWRWG